jgi:hypothetical protein
MTGERNTQNVFKNLITFLTVSDAILTTRRSHNDLQLNQAITNIFDDIEMPSFKYS